MPDPPRELLVLIDRAWFDEALARLRAMATVTQVLAPRLILLRVEPDERQQVARLRGVVGVFDETLPDLTDFTDAERLFASAWAQRARPKRRPRKGES